MLGKKVKPDQKELKTCKKRRVCRPIPLQLSDDVVLEILIRLPVKTILQFKTVCKAWHTIISHPSFIRMHLQQSATKHKQQPNFLIAPHAIDEDMQGRFTFSCDHRYQWQEGQDQAYLACSMAFGELLLPQYMLHCDGLLLVATETGLYVVNPATSDILELLDGDKYEMRYQAVGFGLDRRSNRYKVVRQSCRSIDSTKGRPTYVGGMEVFTIGGGHHSCCSWRETSEVPPYPVKRFRTAIYSKGSLFWYISEEVLGQPPEGILRFSLDDEAFSFVPKPYLTPDFQSFHIVELGEELCLTQYLPTKVVIWTFVDSVNHMWEQRYTLNFPIDFDLSESPVCLPLAMRNGGMIVQHGFHLYCCNPGSDNKSFDLGSENKWELAAWNQLRYHNPMVGMSMHGSDFYFVFTVPYIESLVPLTNMAAA